MPKLESKKVIAFRRNTSNDGFWVITEDGQKASLGQAEVCPSEVYLRKEMIKGEETMFAYQVVDGAE